MQKLLCWAIALPCLASARYPLHPSPAATLPIVDLGYERHQAILEEAGNFYNFSNIPYAQPPVGELRWARPEKINKTSKDINDGSVGHICPQVQPAWVLGGLGFVVAWTQGIWDSWRQTEQWSKIPTAFGKKDGRVSEDCLLLDVAVPKQIFDALANDSKDYYPVPVIVWIHGGGFIFGDKNQFGSPKGLFNATQVFDDGDQLTDGVIYVTLNYRLGAFGWLSAPDFIKEGGVSNAGLWDQKLALEWVKTHIGKFGGDPDRVTVFGESAGASSILHHITSFGGPSGFIRETRAPFQRAILQSPAFFPQASDAEEKKIYDTFREKVGASSLAELRSATTETLQAASNSMIFGSRYGQFTFGPAVDETIVPAPPSLLLRFRKFWSNVEILVAHNGNEGLLFTPPTAQTDDSFRQFMSKALPDMSSKDLDFVTKEMYPLKPEYTYKEKIQRVANAISEMAVLCNTKYLIDAFGAYHVYKYAFSIDPGMHGQDAFYTYFSPPAVNHPTGTGNFSRVTAGTVEVAQAMQRSLVAFAKFGTPVDGPEFDLNWREYGEKRDILHFTSTRGAGGALDPIGHIAVVEDPWKDMDTRCDWWQDAPYWQPADESASLRWAGREEL